MDLNEALDEKDSAQDISINFPDSVLTAIEEFLPNADAFDNPDFNTINYINSLFPTEQSLSNIDSVVAKMEYKISSIDDEIQDLVRNQNVSREEGQKALISANKLIKELALQVTEINKQAEKSEEMVGEITSEIKQLDCAKINLTAAITTLNHFHMLVGGIESLRQLTHKHLYKEIVLPLQAIMEVMNHFENYKDIKQINDLRDEVHKIRLELGEQILADFKEAFTASKPSIPQRTLGEACSVVSVLDSKYKNHLLKWFIDMQLQEYIHLFSSNQETAWLDKIDKRYAWIKKHLIKFEETLGAIFPQDWELSELMVVEFCKITEKELSSIMELRKNEIDVKLLLYAIQKTSNFETLLDKRFTGVTLMDNIEQKMSAMKDQRSSSIFKADDQQLSSHQEEDISLDAKETKSPFIGLIGKCFEPYLYLYIQSLDSNLADLMTRFVQDSKSTQQPPESGSGESNQGTVLTSCADLFLFYKKCMVQCTQLTTGTPMLDLARVFQKYLAEYANLVLQASLPKQTSQVQASLSSQIRDLQNLDTRGLIQNFQSLLKEGECVRFNTQELFKITSVITTAEYCLETTVHLEQKLKEKVTPDLGEKIDITPERDLFHKIITNSIQLLVQDLEIACEPSLIAMTKISWQNIECVGDQSGYVTQICVHLRTSIPILRDNLSSSRKFFTQFCIKFANSFIPKFTQNLYKCKPISTVGSEQLLLDTHMLKTVLLNLPSIGLDIKRTAPSTYTKVVVKMMGKAEMILKLVMSPLDTSESTIDNFVCQFVKLLPDCTLSEFHKVLDMKGIKFSKSQISHMDTMFREKIGHFSK